MGKDMGKLPDYTHVGEGTISINEYHIQQEKSHRILKKSSGIFLAEYCNYCLRLFQMMGGVFFVCDTQSTSTTFQLS